MLGPVAAPVAGYLCLRLSIKFDRAAVGANDPHQQFHQCALARSIFAANAANFTGGKGKRDLPKSFDLAETLGELTSNEHARRLGRSVGAVSCPFVDTGLIDGMDIQHHMLR